MPEFADDAALVRTTKLITEAASPSPARPNIDTNGLTAGLINRHGVTDMIAASARM